MNIRLEKKVHIEVKQEVGLITGSKLSCILAIIYTNDIVK